MTHDNYFRGASGTRYTYAEIADRIRQEAPHTLGEHIFGQLEAIGLLAEMRDGSTPCGLPYSFADKPRLIQKQLTSSGMFHTPGLFRALQNDHRIKGETRLRAIKTFSEGYSLPREEAEGLLSGAIKCDIDDDAGTITYTIAQPDTTQSTHTPGPWSYEEETERIYFADGDIEPTIAVVDLENTSPEQAKGDGHLLAAAPRLLSACRMVVDRWERGDLAEAARACTVAITEAERRDLSTGRAPETKPYSVLLLYPGYANDDGEETYYTFVTACDPIEAVVVAQREAVAAQTVETYDPTDFQPLLVTQGHHYSEPLFNQ